MVFVLREEESDVSMMRPLLTAMGLGVLASGAWTGFGESVAGVALESTTGFDLGEKNEVIDLNPGCVAKDELLLGPALAFGFPISHRRDESGKIKKALANIRVQPKKKTHF